jgi:hypothetical protein
MDDRRLPRKEHFLPAGRQDLEREHHRRGRWHPINDNDAIDAMAAVITFAEPVPNILFKKILGFIELGDMCRGTISSVE